MAKSNRGRRDTSDQIDVAIQRMVAPAVPVTPIAPSPVITSYQVPTDPWDEYRVNQAINVDGTPSRYKADRGTRPFRDVSRAVSFGRGVVAFANDPLNPVIHCIRRKTRRQVLFALRPKRRGRGAGRRKWHSKYGC